MMKRFNSRPYSSHFSPRAAESCSTVVSMGRRGAGFAAFSGLDGRDIEAGVAGDSAFEMPFGVEVPFGGWMEVDEVGFTIVTQDRRTRREIAQRVGGGGCK